MIIVKQIYFESKQIKRRVLISTSFFYKYYKEIYYCNIAILMKGNIINVFYFINYVAKIQINILFNKSKDSHRRKHVDFNNIRDLKS